MKHQQWTIATFQPFIDWFSQHSSSKDNPGDKLVMWQLQVLEEAFNTRMSGSSPSAAKSPSGLGWGLDQGGLQPNIPPGVEELTATSDNAVLIKELQDKVKALEEQMEDWQGEIALVVFKL